jgi:hypothetical protein
MGRKPGIFVFIVALALAACGGGGGGGFTPSGGGGTPTPGHTATPTPRPSATPTPTPTPLGTPTPTPIPTSNISTPAPLTGAGVALSGPDTDSSADWGPPGVAKAFDLPVQHGWDGAGQTVAVVIDSDVSRSDLSAFLSYFQIPSTSRTVTTVAVSPQPAPSINPGGAQDEATLDVETIAGLAPGANVMIYQINSLSDQNITDAYAQIVSDGKAFVVNSSFGGCEGGVVAQEDPVILQGAQAGITFTASSGDSGNECDTGTHTVAASWPASNPHVVGVGGTATNPNGGFVLTTPRVWNDRSCGSQCAGGGGVSTVYPLPSYQLGITGLASSTRRNTPDISFPGEDVAVFDGATWEAFNGTSWSSPEAAALFAEVYQYCNAAGGPIAGVTEPATIPYYVHTHYPTAYLDVTQGNDQIGSSSPFYTATNSYDDASGFGVPYGMAFANTACPSRMPATGLAMRRVALSASDMMRHGGAYTTDVTPRVRDISDEGIRGANEPTTIQIVLQPTGSLASDEVNVVNALQNAGFRITKRFASHIVVDAEGPSSLVARYFRTSIHNVLQWRYGQRYLPTTQIVVPAQIAPYAARVSLDNIVTRHHRLETH